MRFVFKILGKKAVSATSRTSAQNGFTLVELLVTVAVLSVLSAMSVAQFQEYKAKAFDLHAVSAIQNASLGLEAYYVDKNSYLSCERIPFDNYDSCTGMLPGFAEPEAHVGLRIYGFKFSDERLHAYSMDSCSNKGTKFDSFSEIGNGSGYDVTSVTRKSFRYTSQGSGKIIPVTSYSRLDKYEWQSDEDFRFSGIC